MASFDAGELSDGRRQPILPTAAHWDGLYREGQRPWGEGPSELARLAVARLESPLRSLADPSQVTILDVGCGYGRDSRYLAAELGCRVYGIDPSPAAITSARASRSRRLTIEYEVADAVELAAQAEHVGAYDVIHSCNVYALLGPQGRREFVAALAKLAKPSGLLFLSTLSPRDPQHYAVGRQVLGEERSWIEHVYLHFCTAEELTNDFAPFVVFDLEERSYLEEKPGGAAHRHASWLLEGRRR